MENNTKIITVINITLICTYSINLQIECTYVTDKKKLNMDARLIITGQFIGLIAITIFECFPENVGGSFILLRS